MTEAEATIPWATPLRRSHQRAVLLAMRGAAFADWTASGLLLGQRIFGWPQMALYAQRDLGNVRHALAQRVVAGTMTIYPPIAPTIDAAT